MQLFLEGREIEVYLPALTLPDRRYPRRTREEPFFARYLFARLDPTTVPLSSLNWAPGVTSLVGFAGQPARVPDEVIGWLRRRLAEVGESGLPAGRALRPNARLRIAGGPLKGVQAVFDRHASSQERARVLVDILGRLTACEVPLEWLEEI